MVANSTLFSSGLPSNGGAAHPPEGREELQVAQEELRALIERLRSSEAARSELFANVSHELRTPLTLIVGPLRDLVESGRYSGEDLRTLLVVLRNSQLLEKHVTDLLLVAKSEAAEAELTPTYTELDLAVLLRTCASHFESAATHKRVELVVEAPAALRVEADSEMLQRAVLNLLSNAFKFTPAGGKVRCVLSADQAGLVAWLSVSDSGPGVPPELRDAIFERFRRGSGTAAGKFTGFGLGLSIVRAFVDLHHGRVFVDESEEGGARFTIELPVRAPAVAHVVRGERHRSEAIPPITADLVPPPLVAERDQVREGRDERPWVLVVEDNEEMARFICRCLAEDCRTMSAPDGREALARAYERTPDLIVTDVMMPKMTGPELLAALQKDLSLRSVPVLVVSAREDDELRASLLRSGAKDYVTKPFSVHELRARVKNLIDTKRAADLLSRQVDSQRSDLVALAQAVTVHQESLHRALAEAHASREAAERASQVKSNFLRMMSHELRTPVTALQLQLELIQRSAEAPLSSKQVQLVDRMRHSSQRLLDLIELCLEYSRIESGRFEPRQVPISLNDVVQEAVNEFAGHAERKGLVLTFEAQARLPLIESDRSMLRLITVNLIGNAVKFTEQGSVAVRTAFSSGAVQIIVADTGLGIPADAQEEIFRPFRQLKDIRSQEGTGSGLGLWLVSEFVYALGGQISLQSEAASGSTFTVSFPLDGQVHLG